MGLDKWIKPEKEKDVIKKKLDVKTDEILKNKAQPNNLISEPKKLKPLEEPKSKLKFTKFLLRCPKTKCNYQKKILKKELSDKDKICPRCKSEMKFKKS